MFVKTGDQGHQVRRGTVGGQGLGRSSRSLKNGASGRETR